MTGLLIYLFTGCGLAGLVPRLDDKGAWAGARLFIGISLIPLIVFFLHPVAGLPWRAACFIAAGIAVAGYGRLAWQLKRDPASRPPAIHPIFVLPVLVSAIIIVHGGVSYLPYAGDEFSNWIGVAKQLFAAGSYDAGRPHLINPTYTAGWPFLMAYPMVLLDRFDEGLAASAPLVLQIACAGIVYDLLQRAFDAALPGDSRRTMLSAWAVVLLLLASEATGRLWPYNLLIEPPQIAGYAAILLLVLHAGRTDGPEESKGNIVWALVGVLLAAQYMIKVAVLSLMPALVLAVIAASFTRGGLGEKGRNAAVRLALILGPLVVTALLWRRLNPEIVCLTSPFSLLQPDKLALLMSDRAGDLAQRFGAAVWSYIASYKVPLTVAGTAGLLLGIASRRLWLVCGVVLVFATCYFGALYWYHLTCLGDYYFRELNSIQRFTRVVLRLVHGVGLIVLVLWTTDRIRHGGFAWMRSLWTSRRIPVLLALPIAGLVGWEAVKLDRTVADLATRTQPVLPNVRIIPPDAQKIRALIGTRLPHRPVAAVIDVATGLDAWLIAYYHGIGTTFAAGPHTFTVIRRWSWGTPPADEAAAQAWEADVLSTLRQADFVWPLVLDPSMQRLLASRVVDEACRKNLTGYFLLPVRGDRPGFTCVRK